MKAGIFFPCILIVLCLTITAVADPPGNGNLTNTTGLNSSSNATGVSGNILPVTMVGTPGTTVNQTGSPPLNTSQTVPANQSILTNAPPVLLLNIPDIRGETVTVNGIASAGSPGTSITDVTWNWGDSNLSESHNFPFAHSYQAHGEYRINVTAYQSDGQVLSRSLVVNVSSIATIIPTAAVPSFPTGPGPQLPVPISTPSVTLFSPVIDHLNVTLNGYTDPGLQNATIKTLIIEWGDGSIGNSTSFPDTHAYASGGLFTANITAIRSDGEKTTRSVAFEVNDQIAPAGIPPGDQGGFDNQLRILIVIVTILAVIVIGGLIQRFIHKKQEKATPDLPRSVAKFAEAYYRAKEKGDPLSARESAEGCAHLLRTLAATNPDKRSLYLEKAALWDTIAANIERNVGIREDGTGQNEKGAVVYLSSEDYIGICSDTDVEPGVLGAVISLAIEIAHEGREGKAVGTSFIVGDTKNVMEHSKQFVLNPFYGHREAERWITDAGMRENIKEFAQLDGAFVITGKGLVEAAGRNITVDTSDVRILRGMGARHASVAGVTLVTKSIGVVVSQSGGRISIMKEGKIVRIL